MMTQEGAASRNRTPILTDLYAQLRSSATGLTSDEARARLKQYGPNETTSVRPGSLVVRFLAAFANPLSIILILAAFVTGVLGDWVSATIIIIIVFLSAFLDFAQTTRSQNAAARLRSQVTPTATVLRDGRDCELTRREIVPGDVIRLMAGDLVPADARLIQSRDLHVNQAALTGESLPAEKEASDDAPVESGNASNMVYMGTSVVSGTATALVTATGKETQFGDIAARLATRPPETEFERGIRRFSFFIMQTVFCLVLFIVIVAIAFHRDALQSLLFALSLAVGLTPEFLPMIVTVTLGEGALQMSRRKVIVKNLASMENFGSMDVLCSDKTGTLTTGVMRLDRCLASLGQPSPRVFLLAYLNSLYQSGVQDPANTAMLQHANTNPLDAAIVQYDTPDIKAYVKLDEIPFDFERRRVSVVVEHEGQRMLIAKGAPESILSLCVSYQLDGDVCPLDPGAKSKCAGTYRDLSAQGFRVLAVGYRLVPTQEAYHIPDEQDLILAGYLAFVDPPLPDAGQVVQELKEDGVQIKILTGDNEAVARYVCGNVGLRTDKIIRGEELDRKGDNALSAVAEQADIFARVSPAQKDRIILALKRRSHVTGYIGDGINDAPSLHTADVGISVANAVDVAKDAADIILMERSMRVLHAGVLEGRKAFGNVMKYLLMGTSSNFGNMFSMAGAFLFLPFLPMLPKQILLNNFMYDLSQLTIPTDNVDESFIRQPHRWDISFIRTFMLVIGPVSSIFDFLTFYVMLNVFHAGEALFHTGWFVESLATQTLVLFVIRTAGNPLRSRPSLPLTVTVLAVVAIGCLLPFSPLATVLGFTPLPAGFFLFLAAAIVAYLGLVQVVKSRLVGRLLV